MALPIRPTPVLDEEESERFLDKVEREMNTPSYPKGDPVRLEQARQKAMANAVRRSQSNTE